MKKVLLLGSSSFTGNYIWEQLGSEYQIAKVNRSGEDAVLKFDALEDDTQSLREVLTDIDVVINCISNGDVDSCESNPELSEKLNYQFVEDLVGLQDSHNFHLIHFSSNAIYDGENAPYSESSVANAVNRYGEIKIKADQYIEQHSPKYTILRPITMYGVRLGDQRHNPFSFFYQQLNEHKDIKAVDDVYTNMLYIEDLIKCVRNVINKSIYGSFNISGDDNVNRYEFVSLIKEFIPHSRSNVEKVTSDQFKTVAQRPRNTCFDNTAMKEVIGVFPEDIRTTIQKLVRYLQNETKRAS